jgi:hypothetical protein
MSCAPDSGEEAKNEENEALERHRRSEAHANMVRVDGDEQVFAAGHKRVRMEPVRPSEQARNQKAQRKGFKQIVHDSKFESLLAFVGALL